MKFNTTSKAFCSLPFEKLKVDPSGFVTMCCFQQRKCLGNILDSSLDDIWAGDLAQEIRRTTSEGQLHTVCQIESCPFFHKSATKLPKDVWNFRYPADWEIDMPTQHCNIGGETPNKDNPACLMCERHLRFEYQPNRLKEVCEKLKPYIRHVRSIHIQGVAEAFWKDLIFEVLDDLDVSNHKNHICVSTTTNGTILHEARRRRWLRYPTSILTWSIDAASAETYQLIRRVPMYHRIVDNLLAYARERRAPAQELRIHNNINLLNIHEVEGMVELAAKAGASIDFNPTYAVPLIAVDQNNVKLFQEAEGKIIEAGKRLGVPVTFLRKLTLDFNPNLPTKSSQTPIEEIIQAADLLSIPVSKLLDSLKHTGGFIPFL